MVAIDLDRAIVQLMRCELLSEGFIKELCSELSKLLLSESNVLQLKSPITVVGNLHGQFHDLLELFHVAGKCPDVNYLFLGDFVDRGHFSVETISLISCMKLRYPDRVFVIRGSHESRAITKAYGFYGECLRKYGNANIWRYFTDMFDFLPLSAIIDKDVFAIHSGLSPALNNSLDKLKVINRFKDVTHGDLISHLLWATPVRDNGESFVSSPR
jgi:serine/threonine-protein phosphatase PPG1